MLSIVLVLLFACDPYSEAAQANTIEAWTAYLEANPEGANADRARVLLEELMLAKARASGSLEDWDAVLARFPKGQHHEATLKEREASLYAWAQQEHTVAAWERFLTEYPNPKERRAPFAKASLEALTYAPGVKLGEPRVREINLAQDPTGPMNGWAVEVDVTNGDRVVEAMWYRVHYLGAEGRSLGHADWPVVAPLREFPNRVPDPWTVPLQPGETRMWQWTTGEVPEGWSKQVRIVPIRVRFAPQEPASAP